MFVTYEEKERNKKISRKLLFGASVTEVAHIYGISRGRCIQILREYCSRKDRYVYMSITGLVSRPPGITQLREYADVFLDDNEIEEDITINSPVWRINYFPIQIINALDAERIYTVKELMSSNTAMLKRIPSIAGTLDSAGRRA
jgi:hypothetical protein